MWRLSALVNVCAQRLSLSAVLRNAFVPPVCAKRIVLDVLDVGLAAAATVTTMGGDCERLRHVDAWAASENGRADVCRPPANANEIEKPMTMMTTNVRFANADVRHDDRFVGRPKG